MSNIDQEIIELIKKIKKAQELVASAEDKNFHNRVRLQNTAYPSDPETKNATVESLTSDISFAYINELGVRELLRNVEDVLHQIKVGAYELNSRLSQ